MHRNLMVTIFSCYSALISVSLTQFGGEGLPLRHLPDLLFGDRVALFAFDRHLLFPFRLFAISLCAVAVLLLLEKSFPLALSFLLAALVQLCSNSSELVCVHTIFLAVRRRGQIGNAGSDLGRSSTVDLTRSTDGI